MRNPSPIFRWRRVDIDIARQSGIEALHFAGGETANLVDFHAGDGFAAQNAGVVGALPAVEDHLHEAGVSGDGGVKAATTVVLFGRRGKFASFLLEQTISLTDVIGCNC